MGGCNFQKQHIKDNWNIHIGGMFLEGEWGFQGERKNHKKVIQTLSKHLKSKNVAEHGLQVHRFNGNLVVLSF